MRTSLLIVAALTAGACSDTCGLGNQLNGRVYDAYIHPVEVDPATNIDGLPLYASPGNGTTQIGFEWGTANSGPITVFLDGQAFEGEGIFFEQDCGNFSASWSGVYIGPDQPNGVPTEHAIGVVGIFQFYEAADGAQVLAGDLDWKETWKFGTNQGDYLAPITELRGQIGGAAVTAQ